MAVTAAATIPITPEKRKRVPAVKKFEPLDGEFTTRERLALPLRLFGTELSVMLTLTVNLPVSFGLQVRLGLSDPTHPSGTFHTYVYGAVPSSPVTSSAVDWPSVNDNGLAVRLNFSGGPASVTQGATAPDAGGAVARSSEMAPWPVTTAAVHRRTSDARAIALGERIPRRIAPLISRQWSRRSGPCTNQREGLWASPI